MAYRNKPTLHLMVILGRTPIKTKYTRALGFEVSYESTVF